MAPKRNPVVKHPGKPGEMIMNAIDILKGTRHGSSLKEITTFVAEDSGMTKAEVRSGVRLALKKGIEYGVITYDNGSYRLKNLADAVGMVNTIRGTKKAKKVGAVAVSPQLEVSKCLEPKKRQRRARKEEEDDKEGAKGAD